MKYVFCFFIINAKINYYNRGVECMYGTAMEVYESEIYSLLENIMLCTYTK